MYNDVLATTDLRWMANVWNELMSNDARAASLLLSAVHAGPEEARSIWRSLHFQRCSPVAVAASQKYGAKGI
jgi:hypothetical protein